MALNISVLFTDIYDQNMFVFTTNTPRSTQNFSKIVLTCSVFVSLVDVRLCNSCGSSLVHHLEASICLTISNICLPSSLIRFTHFGRSSDRNRSLWLLRCLARSTFDDMLCKCKHQIVLISYFSFGVCFVY